MRRVGEKMKEEERRQAGGRRVANMDSLQSP